MSQPVGPQKASALGRQFGVPGIAKASYVLTEDTVHSPSMNNASYNPSAEILTLINKSSGKPTQILGTAPSILNGGLSASKQDFIEPITDQSTGISPPSPSYDINNYFSMTSGNVPQSRTIVAMTKRHEAEFNLGGEDFPALPGYKGTSIDTLEESGVSQGQTHYPYSNNSAHTQVPYALNAALNTPLNKATTATSLITNQQQISSNYLQQPEMDNLLGQSSGAANYQQIMPQMQRQPPSGAPVSKKKNFATDRFGLIGLLSVIRMTDADLNTLALGTDLTTLGLNLNSPDCLYSTFASPWAEGPSRREPEFYIPMCYYMQVPLQSPILKTNLFSEETLFYIFYSMPKEALQASAAAELYKRDWRYHKEHKLWFTRVVGSEPTQKTNTYERGSYIYFDVNAWERVRKDNFVLAYDQLESSAPPTVAIP